jgi:hypothetical protein
MDIDKIPFGFDFREQIREVLEQSDIVLVVMGPDWVARKDDGSNRLTDEADPVRFEMEMALHLKKPLIPVLVNDASMPKASELPESIRQLVYFNAAEIDAGRDFRVHIDRLMHAMDQILARQASPPAADDPEKGRRREASPNPLRERTEPARPGIDRKVDPKPVERKLPEKEERDRTAPVAKPPAPGRWPALRDATIGALCIGLAGLLVVVMFGPSGGSAGEPTLAICSALVSGLVGMVMYKRHRFLGIRAALVGVAGGIVAGAAISEFLTSAALAEVVGLIVDRLASPLALVFIAGNGIAAAAGSVIAQWRAHRRQPGRLPLGVVARALTGIREG